MHEHIFLCRWMRDDTEGKTEQVEEIGKTVMTMMMGQPFTLGPNHNINTQLHIVKLTHSHTTFLTPTEGHSTIKRLCPHPHASNSLHEGVFKAAKKHNSQNNIFHTSQLWLHTPLPHAHLEQLPVCKAKLRILARDARGLAHSTTKRKL